MHIAYVVINLGLSVLDYQEPKSFPTFSCLLLSQEADTLGSWWGGVISGLPPFSVIRILLELSWQIYSIKYIEEFLIIEELEIFSNPGIANQW